ncbi:hypothetical protein BpHYR1_033081 [Brachionus plicatilis]|uniref:Uncharacterized protein n=1 Tax=Brachionus plicatilis TaxID=10195 RepID=A0A3M7RI81_BRAPC|nr:hypothetical protein BpHYR1_033081 [Brachionus plicatilis]
MELPIIITKGYGAIRSKIGLFTFFNFSIVILVDLDALIPNICFLKCRHRLKLYHHSQNYLVYCSQSKNYKKFCFYLIQSFSDFLLQSLGTKLHLLHGSRPQKPLNQLYSRNTILESDPLMNMMNILSISSRTNKDLHLRSNFRIWIINLEPVPKKDTKKSKKCTEELYHNYGTRAMMCKFSYHFNH